MFKVGDKVKLKEDFWINNSMQGWTRGLKNKVMTIRSADTQNCFVKENVFSYDKSWLQKIDRFDNLVERMKNGTV